jgi:hypothetical protein
MSKRLNHAVFPGLRAAKSPEPMNTEFAGSGSSRRASPFADNVHGFRVQAFGLPRKSGEAFVTSSSPRRHKALIP